MGRERSVSAVAGGHGQHHGLPVQQVRIEDLPVEGRPGQAQVELTRQQALDLLAGHQFLEVDVHVGKNCGDLFQQRAQDAEPAGCREPDPQHARASRGDPAWR